MALFLGFFQLRVAGLLAQRASRRRRLRIVGKIDLESSQSNICAACACLPISNHLGHLRPLLILLIKRKSNLFQTSSEKNFGLTFNLTQTD